MLYVLYIRIKSCCVLIFKVSQIISIAISMGILWSPSRPHGSCHRHGVREVHNCMVPAIWDLGSHKIDEIRRQEIWETENR